MCIAFCQVEEMNFSQEEPEGQDDSFSHFASTCLGDLWALQGRYFSAYGHWSQARIPTMSINFD
jgi:hypothetical protein